MKLYILSPSPVCLFFRWNPAAEMQAIDRTHRLGTSHVVLLFTRSLSCLFIDASFVNIGQYRPIRAVRFIAENTVEERILQLQEKKRLVFDGTVGRYVF